MIEESGCIAEGFKKRHYLRPRCMTSQRLTDGLLISSQIIVEMENALKRGPTYSRDLLKEAKRIEFPDNVIGRLNR